MTKWQQIGKILANARRQQTMTGVDLSGRLGISQSKLSKIENGIYGNVDPSLVTRSLNILGVPKTIQQQVAKLLEDSGTGQQIHVRAYTALDYDQIYEREKQAALIRIFTMNVIPALLQLPEYRQALLGHFEFSGNAQLREAQTIMKRQDLLWGPGKRFEIIMHEAALYSAVAGRAVQQRQLDRLERILGMANLKLGIVPVRAGMPVPDHGNFATYDKRLAVQVMLGGEVYSHDERLVHELNAVFDSLAGRAVYDDDACTILRQAMDYFAV